ncbi:MAG: helix-turn-helix domain-containing protein [Solirubrobacteraceae bacterium]|nr:helix-turn-helix domain-containing protein [Solirubrobacteraceae bacterium]
MPDTQAATQDLLAARRPHRADARRNFDALLAAARAAFTESGTDVSLEDIAKRAGVGIGTLYRNFPTREDLVECVYIDEVDGLSRAAADVASREPWEALSAWLERFVDYVATKHALLSALNKGSETMVAARGALYAAGNPILARAQEAGEVRADTSIQDLMMLVLAVTNGTFVDDAQRARVLAMALDGIRIRD